MIVPMVAVSHERVASFARRGQLAVRISPLALVSEPMRSVQRARHPLAERGLDRGVVINAGDV